MLRSMTSAASALRFHQTFMDVVGNNIANVNTTAFKSGRVTFHEMMNQILSDGAGVTEERGGINPVQIGLGITLGGVGTDFAQGGLQATGRTSDLAIQGDGFFIFQGPTQQLYSRDGMLDVAIDGTLVNPTTGMRILGWMADADGTVNTMGPLTPITIPLAQGLRAKATSRVVLEGNLDAAATGSSVASAPLMIYDSLGNRHDLTITFTKQGDNEWTVAVSEDDGAVTGVTLDPNPALLEFDGTGRLITPDDGTISLTITLNNGADSPLSLDIDLGTLTQVASSSEVAQASQNGYAAGALVDFNVSTSGEVIGIYSSGLRQTIGQIAMATFRNPSGLVKVGQNLYAESNNTGERGLGLAGQGGVGQINSGFLEMSNVDLATQFTEMIRAQRGFQANSRVITASDQMLQELVNLVR